MGRVVGLSWIFCIKRVSVFCLRDLYHLAKALHTLQKIRSNHRQTCRSVGFSKTPRYNKIKKTVTKVTVFFMGRVVGRSPNPLAKLFCPQKVILFNISRKILSHSSIITKIFCYLNLLKVMLHDFVILIAT